MALQHSKREQQIKLFVMDNLFSLFPALFTSIIFISVALFHKLRNKSNPLPNLPPGPWKLPIIGNIHSLIGAPLHRRLAELAYRFGPLMYFKLGELPVVVVSSPEMAKQFMKVHDINFASRPNTLVGEIFFHNQSDIVLAPYGEYWRQTKKVFTVELLTAKRVQTYKSLRHGEVGKVVREISAAADSGTPVNLTELIFLTSYRIICAAAFGREVKHAKKFMPIVMELVELTGGLSIALIFPYAKFFEVFKGTRSVLEKHRERADEILEDILQEHKAARERRRTGRDSNDVDKEEEPLVDVLLNLQEQGNNESHLPDTTIKALLLDCFFGGVHPASTTIEWAMSEMVKNPSVLRKAQAEVRELQDRKGGVLHERDIHELKYLNLVLRETFRMHPPLPLLVARESITRCKVDGHDIPAKAVVLINAWAIGRDHRIWKDPHAFNPERFHDSSVDFKGTNFELIPFGAGRRMCPGITFGMSSVEFQLANLLCHFDWKLPSGKGTEELDIAEGSGSILRKKTELSLIPILSLARGGNDLFQ